MSTPAPTLRPNIARKTPAPTDRPAFLPTTLAVVTLLSVFLLLIWDAAPQLFPAQAHLLLGAMPLALIAVSYLVYQAFEKPGPRHWIRAAILVAAFLLWAVNQLLEELPQATLFNDLAIALFVLDVFFVIIGWPAEAAHEDFAENPPHGSA